MSTNHETLRGLIHGHFGEGLGPSDEALLRAHLPDCAECRQIYECHQVAERLDPAEPSPRERLALALGLPSEASRPLRRSLAWTVASLAVASAVALTVMGKTHGDDGITARGAAVEKAEAVDLAVFRIGSHGESTRLVAIAKPGLAGLSEYAGRYGTPPRVSIPDNAIAADDELAFAYRNEVGKAFLMIFAIEGQNRVLWYHPAWTRSEDNPQALPITKQVGFKELPEAVRHQLQGASLTVYALFMDTPLDVRAVEGRVAHGAFLAQAEAGEILRTLVFKVRP